MLCRPLCKREVESEFLEVRLQLRVYVLDLTLKAAYLLRHGVEVNFRLRLKRIDIPRDIKVKFVFCDLTHRGDVGELLHILALLVGGDDLVYVLVAQDVLVLAGLELL